VEEAAGCL